MERKTTSSSGFGLDVIESFRVCYKAFGYLDHLISAFLLNEFARRNIVDVEEVMIRVKRCDQCQHEVPILAVSRDMFGCCKHRLTPESP